MPNLPHRDLSDLSHVDATRLSRVWPGASISAAGGWGRDEMGDVLRHQLASPLEDPGFAAPSVEPLTHRQLLLEQPRPSADALRRVKDWAKPMMAGGVGSAADRDGDVPREVAGVLYFAAILAARLRAAERISDLTDDRLRDAARWALQLPWLDPAAAHLFRDGLALLGPGVPTGKPPGSPAAALD